MAKKKTRRRYRRNPRRRRRKTRTIPVLPIAGIIASTNAHDGWNNLRQGQYQGWLTGWISGMTGYSIRKQDFDVHRLKQGLLPVLAGIFGHKLMSMVGVNRYLANLPSPLNKIRL